MVGISPGKTGEMDNRSATYHSSLPRMLPSGRPKEPVTSQILPWVYLQGHCFHLRVYFAFTLSENEVTQSTYHFASAIKKFRPRLEFKCINQFDYLFTILSFISFQHKGIIFKVKEPYEGSYLVVYRSHQLSSVDLSVWGLSLIPPTTLPQS